MANKLTKDFSAEKQNGKNRGSPRLRLADVNPFLDPSEEAKSLLKRVEKEKRRYMGIAAFVGALLFLTLSGYVYERVTSDTEAVYVWTDRSSGETLYVGPVEPLTAVPDVKVHNVLQEVLLGLRTVYADRRATTQTYDAAYAHIANGSEAEAFLGDYYRAGTPPELVGDLQTSITAMEISKIAGARSWSLDWVEKTIAEGGPVTQAVYTGSFSVVRAEPNPENEEQFKANPFGIYVDGITWRKVESEVLSKQSSSAQ